MFLFQAVSKRAKDKRTQKYLLITGSISSLPKSCGLSIKFLFSVLKHKFSGKQSLQLRSISRFHFSGKNQAQLFSAQSTGIT